MSMGPRQLRHGLSVLLQYNLLYWLDDDGVAIYEANAECAYNLVRTGKILEMIDGSFGAPARDVMQSLLVSGQTRVSDLITAYQEKIEHLNGGAKLDDGEDFSDTDMNGVNGGSESAKKPEALIKSKAQLNSVICRLVEAELVDVVHAKTFQSPQDILKGVENDVTDTYFPAGVKGGKGKIEFETKVAEGLRKVRGESKSLKRKLEQNGGAAKRRKISASMGPSNGTTNGTHEDEIDPALDVSDCLIT